MFMIYLNPPDNDPNEEYEMISPAFTSTGEPFQPARVYYHVFKKKTVLGVFQKLRCMEFDRQQNRWNWLYIAEARKLRFNNSYNKIPKHLRPLVLGYFRFRSDEEMTLELRSLQRITVALRFFEKHLNSRVAIPYKLRLVNKIFDEPQDPEEFQTYKFFEHFLDRDDYRCSPAEAEAEEIDEKMIEIEKQYEDEEERKEALKNYMSNKLKVPSPEFEEMHLDLSEDDIDNLDFLLVSRQMEAGRRWKGETNITQYDVMSEMLVDMMKEAILAGEIELDEEE